MKIATVNPDGQPGWNYVGRNSNVWVYLNERRVRGCVAADDAAGVVWVEKRLPNGRFVLAEDRESIALEPMTGKVEIRFLRT